MLLLLHYLGKELTFKETFFVPKFGADWRAWAEQMDHAHGKCPHGWPKVAEGHNFVIRLVFDRPMGFQFVVGQKANDCHECVGCDGEEVKDVPKCKAQTLRVICNRSRVVDSKKEKCHTHRQSKMPLKSCDWIQ